MVVSNKKHIILLRSDARGTSARNLTQCQKAKIKIACHAHSSYIVCAIYIYMCFTQRASRSCIVHATPRRLSCFNRIKGQICSHEWCGHSGEVPFRIFCAPQVFLCPEMFLKIYNMNEKFSL